MSSRMYESRSELQIGQLTPDHWDQVRDIYFEGLATGQATFETQAPAWEDWNANHLPFARLVAFSKLDPSSIVGWAALSRVSSRSAYAGVAEVSVYVGKPARGQGVGKALLEGLIRVSEENGVWTLQASVFPENIASVSLHKACGFREVGIRDRIGKLSGVWRDTMLLERRSRLTEI